MFDNFYCEFKHLECNGVNVHTLFFNCIFQLFRFIVFVEGMLTKDISDNKSIGEFGSKEIVNSYPKNFALQILTHCNTGSLATAGYGTALGVIRSLHLLNRLGKFK